MKKKRFWGNKKMGGVTAMKKYDFYCEGVLNGKTPIKILYESANVLAFYHTKPSYVFHVVIVPKEHIKDLLALEKKYDSLILEIINVARKIIAEKINVKNEGVRLITNLGKFQDTPHLHFHLVSGDKLK